MAAAEPRSIRSNEKKVVDDRLIMACAGAARQAGVAMAAEEKKAGNDNIMVLTAARWSFQTRSPQLLAMSTQHLPSRPRR